MDTGQ